MWSELLSVTVRLPKSPCRVPPSHYVSLPSPSLPFHSYNHHSLLSHPLPSKQLHLPVLFIPYLTTPILSHSRAPSYVLPFPPHNISQSLPSPSLLKAFHSPYPPLPAFPFSLTPSSPSPVPLSHPPSPSASQLPLYNLGNYH